MRAFYNDTERFACDWLQHLMDAGEIMPGMIDDRSIADLSPDDLAGFERVHLFAGVGGWELALRIAGWRSGPVWTCSCPCPPFSQAGKRQRCPRCEGTSLVWCPRRTGYCICADCSHAWLADGRHLCGGDPHAVASMMDAKTLALFRKVLGMLGSSHAGERAAAALKATAMLKAAGKTWGDVGVGVAPAVLAQRYADQTLVDLYRRFLDDERARTTDMAKEIGRLKREVNRLKGMWPKGKPKVAA
jgi:hypothetical protein